MQKFCLCLVILVFLSSFLPVQAANLSDKLIKHLGDSAGSQLEDEYGLSNSPKLQARVKNIAHRLDQTKIMNGKQFDVRVLNSGDINALALPGGRIYVLEGLLDNFSADEEVAFVMSHEYVHCLKNHGVKQMILSTGLGALLGGDNSDEANVKQILKILLISGRSRSDERDADREAISLMLQAGYDLSGALGAMRRLECLETKKPTLISKLFSTHPPTADRCQVLKNALLQANYGTDYLTNPNVLQGAATQTTASSTGAGPEKSTEITIDDGTRGTSNTNVALGANGEYCLIADYISQFWQKEGDLPASLSNMNCAPTSVEMSMAYLLGRKPTHANVVALNKAMGRKNPLKGAITYYKELVPAMKKVYGYEPKQVQYSLDEMLAEVDAGGMVVTDVKYDCLSNRQDTGYKGDHVLVIVGHTKEAVICHDPDDPSLKGKGAYVRYDRSEFQKSLGNPKNTCLIGFRPEIKDTAVPKTNPTKYDAVKTKILIEKGPIHLGDDTKDAKMIWAKEFELTEQDLSGASQATISIEVKAEPEKDPRISFNRHEVGVAVATSEDWEKFSYTFKPDFLFVGKNLVDLETIIVNLQNTYDDCDFRNLKLTIE